MYTYQCFIIMKILTDFRKTVETGLDPRLVKVDWHELLCFGSPTVYNLRPSTCSSVSCGRILQRAYCADQGISRAVRSL